jgi:hypothetical protein
MRRKGSFVSSAGNRTQILRSFSQSPYRLSCEEILLVSFFQTRHLGRKLNCMQAANTYFLEVSFTPLDRRNYNSAGLHNPSLEVIYFGKDAQLRARNGRGDESMKCRVASQHMYMTRFG